MVLVGIKARPLAPADLKRDSLSSLMPATDSYPESERFRPLAVVGRESGLYTRLASAVLARCNTGRFSEAGF